MRNYIYACLAALALVCGTLSSCSNETDEVSAQNGGLVSFSIDNNASRVYRDSTDPLQLKWEEGDKVQIYSPECTTQSGSHFATYTVHIDDNGKAKLQYNADGLVWPEEEKKCRFYATLGEVFYTDDITTYDDGYLNFSASRYPNYTKLYKQYLYMLAEAEVDYTKRGPVSLEFKVISTTVDIYLTNGTGKDLVLESISLILRIKSNKEYYTWNLENAKWELSGDNEITGFISDKSNIELSANEVAHLYIELHPHVILEYDDVDEISIRYHFTNEKAGAHKKLIRLSSSFFPFKQGTLNKRAINFTGK